MIGPIKIDLSELAEEFALTETQITDLSSLVIHEITKRIYHNWLMEAINGLKSTRKQYVQNLNVGYISPHRSYIQLTGEFPNMLERGFGPYDMKPILLKSRKVKYTKKGTKYITVPFRWATTGAIGESEVFANIMPKSVYTIAKNLKAQRTHFQKGIIQRGRGLRTNQLPEKLRIPKTRAKIIDPKTGDVLFGTYTHKAPIYSGIIRQQKTYENATQNSYVSFRRVSENSDPLSWIHKGVAAKQFAEKALQKTDIGNIVNRTVDIFLQQI